MLPGHKYSQAGEFNPDKGVTLEVFLDLHVEAPLKFPFASVQ